jgi:Ala-tRNA(Pro) deacylase
MHRTFLKVDHTFCDQTSEVFSEQKRVQRSGGRMSATSSIYEFLREADVPYTVVPHRPGSTAREEAAAAQVPGREWARVILCFVDGQPIEAVVPATLAVDLDRLLQLARGKEIRFGGDDERRRLFPGCESGAIPPLGPLYGHQVFVEVTLAAEAEIIFNAGTHTEAISMSWADFAASVRPIVGKFGAPAGDHVGAFRLSFRE